MKPEGAPEALPEPTLPQPLVAGPQGEQLLVRVRPQTAGRGDSNKHRHVVHGPRYRRALPRWPVIGELIQQDDGGGDDYEGRKPHQHERPEPPDGPGTCRGQPLPGHTFLIDLERRWTQLLHLLQYTRVARSGLS